MFDIFLICIVAIAVVSVIAILVYIIRESLIRRKVLEIAVRSGCDIDGDIITYNKKRYYVDISRKFVMEVH